MSLNFSRNRLVFLFRSFFPSWKFFENFGAYPQLEYRLISKQHNSDWQPYFEKSDLSASETIVSLIFNPQGNYRLLLFSTLQHLLEEINIYGKEVVNTSAFRIVKDLVWRQAEDEAQQQSSHEFTAFQFRVRINTGAINEDTFEDVLISPEFNLRETSC